MTTMHILRHTEALEHNNTIRWAFGCLARKAHWTNGLDQQSRPNYTGARLYIAVARREI